MKPNSRIACLHPTLVARTLAIYICTYNNMWQSCIEIEYYLLRILIVSLCSKHCTCIPLRAARAHTGCVVASLATVFTECHLLTEIQRYSALNLDSVMRLKHARFLRGTAKYVCVIAIQCGTSLLWTPWGHSKVSCIEKCPHFRGKFLLRKYTWDITKCLQYRGIFISECPLREAPLYSQWQKSQTALTFP